MKPDSEQSIQALKRIVADLLDERLRFAGYHDADEKRLRYKEPA